MLWRGVDVRRRYQKERFSLLYLAQVHSPIISPFWGLCSLLLQSPSHRHTLPHLFSFFCLFHSCLCLNPQLCVLSLSFHSLPHPRHVIAPSGCLPPRSLFQEVPTALRVHRVPDRNEDGFYCTMTNSKHFFFAEIRMKNQEV